MHTIYRTVRSYRGNDAPQSSGTCAQTHFLAFHGTIVLSDTHGVDTRVTVHLLIYVDTYARQESEQHYAVNGITQFFTLDIETECESHSHRKNQDGPAFRHVGQISRVFQRMRRVTAEVTTTVRT